MDFKVKSLQDIRKFLKDCKKDGNQISFFEFNGNILKLGMSVPQTSDMTPVIPKGSAKKAEEIAEKSSLQMQFDFAQEQVDTLMLEDPALAEAMLIRGELEKENH